MNIFPCKKRSWKGWKIICGLGLVLLMIIIYSGAHTNASVKTHGLARDVNIVNGVGDNAGKQRQVRRSLTHRPKLVPLTKYWAKILHFVPEVDGQNCLNLFTTASSRSARITPEWEKARDSVQMSEFGRLFAPQHFKLTLTYQELARQEFVHTVCEIGFNVGQSAVTWLTAKPDLKLYSFDIGGQRQERIGRAIEKLYLDRFKLTIGDSRKTVPLWIKQGVKCDIVFIDGGHSYHVVLADILNMQKAAASQHIMVIDDIYAPGVNRAWKEMMAKDVVHHLFDCYIKGQDIDFALGYYKNFTGNV